VHVDPLAYSAFIQQPVLAVALSAIECPTREVEQAARGVVVYVCVCVYVYDVYVCAGGRGVAKYRDLLNGWMDEADRRARVTQASKQALTHNEYSVPSGGQFFVIGMQWRAGYWLVDCCAQRASCSCGCRLSVAVIFGCTAVGQFLPPKLRNSETLKKSESPNIYCSRIKTVRSSPDHGDRRAMSDE
jgi:fucose permease